MLAKTNYFLLFLVILDLSQTQPVIQVTQQCDTKQYVPDGYLVTYPDCFIVRCIQGCKKCYNPLSCTECLPGLIYFGGGLKVKDFLGCITEWERDILIKYYAQQRIQL